MTAQSLTLLALLLGVGGLRADLLQGLKDKVCLALGASLTITALRCACRNGMHGGGSELEMPEKSPWHCSLHTATANKAANKVGDPSSERTS